MKRVEEGKRGEEDGRRQYGGGGGERVRKRGKGRGQRIKKLEDFTSEEGGRGRGVFINYR